jgi:hypothetical protein
VEIWSQQAHDRLVRAPQVGREESPMNSIPPSESRTGELTRPRSGACVVTINKRDGVVAVTLSEVDPPNLPDGNYKLTVKGEPPSHWQRDKNGWARLK